MRCRATTRHSGWLSVAVAALALCLSFAQAASPPGREVASGVWEIGRLQHPRLTESSGIVASHTQSNVFWTHTDGGGKKQVLYAIDRTGKPLAEYRVSGALVTDWEDISSDGEGHLFIGDIGNNDSRRGELAVCQIDEPRLGRPTDGFVTVTRTWRLRFPKKPFDCESLFIWESSGYVVSKVFDDKKAEMYRFSLTNNAPFQVLQPVAELKIDSPVTGATISPDGRLLAVVAKNGAYVCRIKGNPAHAEKAKFHHTKFKEHVEACTFVPEGLLTTAESRQIYLFTDEAFHPPPKTK